MTHLDLFSGIGGFALAARWAGFQTIGFCEVDRFCTKVLNKNFPDVKVEGDIRELDGEQYRGVYLITGGYPCQPFSRAGKQKGEHDERHLWPEMFRVIKQARPPWVLCENVVDHQNMGLDQVLSDLESQGYTTRSFIIPAGAVQCNHARERLWVVAYNECFRSRMEESNDSRQDRELSHKPISKMVLSQDREASTERVKPCRLFFDKEAFYAEGQSKPLFLGGTHGIPHRVDRYRGLGNAIVPEVAYQLIKPMAYT